MRLPLTDVQAPAAQGTALASRAVRFDTVAQLSLMLLLAVGCWRVLAPFFPAMLFAGVIASSTWPFVILLRRGLGGRRALASLVACVIAVVLAVGPMVLLLTAVADGAAWSLSILGDALAKGLPPLPGWIERAPLLGSPLAQGWAEFGADPQRLKNLLASLSAPAREAVLFSGRVLGNAALQALLTALLLFFLYNNGEVVARSLRRATFRIGGRFALELIQTAKASINGVMFGVLGAGLAQGMVAAAGFAIAGVPNPVFLGAITFVVSMVPIGPPIVWAGAAAWLFQHGAPGWAVFMVIYGMFGISSIDNVIKPLLISRANHLPFVITLMGVVGGVIAFGVPGVLLGPTLVALCLDLGHHWLRWRPRSALAPANEARR